MAKDFWSSVKTELFIELWESKPCLYDTTKETYHDRNVKKRAREDIAQALGTEGEFASIYNNFLNIILVAISQ